MWQWHLRHYSDNCVKSHTHGCSRMVRFSWWYVSPNELLFVIWSTGIDRVSDLDRGRFWPLWLSNRSNVFSSCDMTFEKSKKIIDVSQMIIMWQYREEIHQQWYRCMKIIYFSKKCSFQIFFLQMEWLHVVLLLLWNLSGNWNVNKCQLLSAVVWSKMTTSLMLDWELRWKLKWYWSEIWGEIEIKKFF